MTTKAIPVILKIVTVEDSSIIVSRLKSMLSDIHGVAFIGNASTIPEALVLMKRGKPDVAILDIHLNGQDGNGIDLLILIRKIYPVMKIIMLTNLTENLYRTACMELGADFFLDKSNDFEKIPDALAQIIRMRQNVD
jgi:DNA-binding NarL/FixJ family response regulator